MSVLGLALALGQQATTQRIRNTANKTPIKGGNKIHAINSRSTCVRFI